MEAQSDFKELLELFNKHGVEYLIVGGYALAFHGAPRYTGDLDLLLKPDPGNARKVVAALKEFGFGGLGLGEGDFHQPGQVVQLGVPPVRVDLLTSIDGISWEAADAGKAPGKYAEVTASYLGRKEFIRNKRAIGRQKDLADIEALGEG
jgi:hypothetical protein